MKTLVSSLLLAFTSIAISASAIANEDLTSSKSMKMDSTTQLVNEAVAETYPEAMNVVLQGGLLIKQKFEAAGGLTGWLIATPTGSNSIVYTPPSGDVLIAGSLVTMEGEDLTATYMEQFVNYDEFYDKLEEVDAIVVGAQETPTSTIYAFLDASCIYCNYLYKALVPYVEKGLQVKWIPVGILGPSSAGQAAALMAAPDRAAALHDHEINWNKNGSKGISPIAVTSEMKKQLDSNSQLLSDLGGSGTPLILYKNASGSWQKVAGMPRLSEIPGITGMDEQPISDPDLMRFR